MTSRSPRRTTSPERGWRLTYVRAERRTPRVSQRRKEREEDSFRQRQRQRNNANVVSREVCREQEALHPDDVCYDGKRRRRRLGCNKRPRVSRRANMNEPSPRPVARLDLCVANREELVGTGECDCVILDVSLTRSEGRRGTNSLSSIFDEYVRVHALKGQRVDRGF